MANRHGCARVEHRRPPRRDSNAYVEQRLDRLDRGSGLQLEPFRVPQHRCRQNEQGHRKGNRSSPVAREVDEGGRTERPRSESDSGGSGLQLTAAQNLAVGETPLDELFARLGVFWDGTSRTTANTILTSLAYGLLASGDCTGTSVIRNTILENAPGNVDLTAATGITYVP